MSEQSQQPASCTNCPARKFWLQLAGAANEHTQEPYGMADAMMDVATTFGEVSGKPAPTPVELGEAYMDCVDDMQQYWGGYARIVTEGLAKIQKACPGPQYGTEPSIDNNMGSPATVDLTNTITCGASPEAWKHLDDTVRAYETNGGTPPEA